MFPGIVILRAEINLDERPPLRSLWLPYQMQARLEWSAVRLLRVTRNARANDVFPGGGAPAVARHHVVEVQVLTFKHLAAILTGVLINALPFTPYVESYAPLVFNFPVLSVVLLDIPVIPTGWGLISFSSKTREC